MESRQVPERFECSSVLSIWLRQFHAILNVIVLEPISRNRPRSMLVFWSNKSFQQSRSSGSTINSCTNGTARARCRLEY